MRRCCLHAIRSPAAPIDPLGAVSCNHSPRSFNRSQSRNQSKQGSPLSIARPNIPINTRLRARADSSRLIRFRIVRRDSPHSNRTRARAQRNATLASPTDRIAADRADALSPKGQPASKSDDIGDHDDGVDGDDDDEDDVRAPFAFTFATSVAYLLARSHAALVSPRPR